MEMEKEKSDLEQKMMEFKTSLEYFKVNESSRIEILKEDNKKLEEKLQMRINEEIENKEKAELDRENLLKEKGALEENIANL